jgi:predicted PurR-regulated permease PerM
MYGSILIAVIQGALGALGFWIFGIESFFIWGMVMAIFALVPFVGTAIIWIPAALYLIAKGTTSGNMTLVWHGVGLLLYGVFIISSADNLLKPKLIGDRAGMHPVVVLLGVLGGLSLFGFAGFLIGPLILAAMTSFADIYQKEKILQ